MITVLEKPLDGLILFKNQVYTDTRGFFLETYVKREMEELGIQEDFVQENHSHSVHGVLRGLHFQKNYAQAQIVRVIRGKVYDVAVNINPQSNDFGKFSGVVLSENDYTQLYMSKDYAHGFLVISEYADILYKCSQFYHKEDECGIIYNDSILGINWPFDNIKGDVIVSQKDLLNMTFENYKKTVI